MVEQHSEQEHHAEHGAQPVRVPLGERDALEHHAVDEGTQRRADRRAEAPGHEAAADDGADDVDELLTHSGVRLHRRGAEQRDHAHEPGGAGGGHEKADLGPHDRHPHLARRGDLPADREDPVARPCAQQHPGGEHRDEEPPEHGDVERAAADRDRGAEQRLDRVVHRHVRHSLDRDLSRDELGHGEVDPREDEERAEGDDEAGQARLHHHVAVERPDRQRERERQEGGDPDVQAPLRGDDADHE
ncbi:hypothetical protein ABE10_10465, partial [Bacillus toyonensis]|nr:hypothetical protein [Bacillus toyonensis]